jgi:hypothetical protein
MMTTNIYVEAHLTFFILSVLSFFNIFAADTADVIDIDLQANSVKFRKFISHGEAPIILIFRRQEVPHTIISLYYVRIWSKTKTGLNAKITCVGCGS